MNETQQDLNEYYKQMKSIPYKERPIWMKYLNDSSAEFYKQRKRIRQHEVLVDDIETYKK